MSKIKETEEKPIGLCELCLNLIFPSSTCVWDDRKQCLVRQKKEK